MLQQKARENYQNFPEEDKSTMRHVDAFCFVFIRKITERYRKFFIENELSEEEKNFNMHAIYIAIFLKKKYAREKCRKLFEEEKDKKHQYAYKRYRNLF